jgi:hypothetical protein
MEGDGVVSEPLSDVRTEPLEATEAARIGSGPSIMVGDQRDEVTELAQATFTPTTHRQPSFPEPSGEARPPAPRKPPIGLPAMLATFFGGAALAVTIGLLGTPAPVGSAVEGNDHHLRAVPALPSPPIVVPTDRARFTRFEPRPAERTGLRMRGRARVKGHAVGNRAAVATLANRSTAPAGSREPSRPRAGHWVDPFAE